jgi:hypothetical protein
MKKALLIVAVIVLAMTLSPMAVLAGTGNQNGDNGKSSERGTEKINHKEGCRPNTTREYWVYMGNPLIDVLMDLLGAPPPPSENPDYYNEWKGGPCCPSNEPSETTNAYPKPNQCCNGPDLEIIPGPFPPFPIEISEPAPGNHCLCFALQGYPMPGLLDNYPLPPQ